MKQALRWIPTEVWVDVFRYPWISRRKLCKIVDKFRNRKFAEFLQFYLHEWGKQTLGSLYLGETNLEILPRTQVPKNIKLFDCIEIRHFDSRTLAFLHRINHLTPLLHGIHSLSFDHRAIPFMEQYFGPKLAAVKMLTQILSDLSSSGKCNQFCPQLAYFG